MPDVTLPPVIRVPSAVTLKKYGLSAEQWSAILASQGGVCAICKKIPTTGLMVTDHHHAKGYKKMSPEQKRSFVRGICCWWCNKTYLGRGITVEKAEAVVEYLRSFAQKREQ